VSNWRNPSKLEPGRRVLVSRVWVPRTHWLHGAFEAPQEVNVEGTVEELNSDGSVKVTLDYKPDCLVTKFNVRVARHDMRLV
jgi:hypothetical protein